MVAIAVSSPGILAVTPQAEPDKPGPGEVLIRVQRAGICGSDVHILHGSNPFARYPRVIGHEFAGHVVEVGAGVDTITPGAAVVVDPVIACGHCYPCRIGRPNVCSTLEVLGVHRDGGFRDHVAVPAANCVPIPDGVPIALATLAEPFAVAANVLSRTGIGADDTVLIYGAGTVGLTVLQVARLHGARCIVSDMDAARLERARGYGAAVILDPRSTPIPDAVRDENEGLGPTVVIDGAGLPSLLEEACQVISPAGRIGLLGFSPAPCNISQQQIVAKELSLVGSRLNRRFIPQVVQWLAEGKLQPAEMITQTIPAADARAAFDLVENEPQRTIKVHLDFAV
jgi:L-gulonate 5-dehydrogenase